MAINFNDKAHYQIMNHWGKWSGVKYTAKTGNVMVEATIPQNTLTKKDHCIPKRALTLLHMPSAENRMKLFVQYGIRVNYIFAGEKAEAVALKEVA